MTLFNELKRRNVIRVGLFYVVSAWLVIELAEMVLPRFDVPDGVLRGLVIVLAIGAAHDTMNPAHMEWMAGQIGRGLHLHGPGGSHLAQYDDQEVYLTGLIDFLRDVDAGRWALSSLSASEARASPRCSVRGEFS